MDYSLFTSSGRFCLISMLLAETYMTSLSSLLFFGIEKNPSQFFFDGSDCLLYLDLFEAVVQKQLKNMPRCLKLSTS